MAEPKTVMEQVDESIVQMTARIMGPSSAAAKAIDDFETRTAAGENVAFHHAPRTWIVGPVIPTADPS